MVTEMIERCLPKYADAKKVFNYTVVITYTNRLDLLEKAVEGIRHWWQNTYIIDNSFGGDLLSHPINGHVKDVIRPLTKFTCSQAFNAAQELARFDNSDVLYMLHGDANPLSGACQRLENFVQGLFDARNNWGCVFTHYDVLAAFNMDAVDVIGEWDTGIDQYPADEDYYHRLRMGGYNLLECGGHDVEHFVSSTLKRDVFYALRNEFFFSINQQYRIAKWADSAVFPFNGKPWDEFFSRITRDPVFNQMMATFETIEGSLCYNDNRNGRLAQFSLLRNLLKAIKPKMILETGTHKCFFAYFVAQFVESFKIVTCDTNEQARKAVSICSTAYPNVNIDFRCGNSVELFKDIPNDTQFDLAWIDGCHDYEFALGDLENAIRLNVPNILIDDSVMPPVKRAIDNTLAKYPHYYEVLNPFKSADLDRNIVVLRKSRSHR